MSTNIIVLKSSDGPTFRIEAAVARQSQLLAYLIEDKCANKEIPIANVTSKILELVVEYCKKHHVDDANPSSEDDLKKWDQQFMQTDQSTIFELILVANYLDIKSLLDLACQTVADMLKGKTPQEIRSEFNIENDYTPEEEEAVRKENQWALDELNDTIIDQIPKPGPSQTHSVRPSRTRRRPAHFEDYVVGKKPGTSGDNEP